MDDNSSSCEFLSDPGKVNFVLWLINSLYVQKEDANCNVPIQKSFEKYNFEKEI